MDEEKNKRVNSFVASRIGVLTINKADSKGEMAIWRHAVAKAVCEDTKAWSLLVRDIPSNLAGFGGTPSKEENASYMAISAFAACGSHTKGITLGQAVASLGDSSRERFTRLEKSRTLDELWRNLKCLLRLISSNKGTGLDYSLLAQDLVNWQFDSLRVVRKWERDYYKKTKL